MTDRPIVVLFGAGQLGRRTAQCIRDTFKVIFCDNFLPMQSINGIPVLPPIAALESFPDVPWVVTIYNGEDVHKQLRDAGIADVRHFMHFYSCYDELLPFGCLENSIDALLFDKVEELSAVVADQKSRDVLAQTLNGLMLIVDDNARYDHPDNIYFPSFIKPIDDEVFVDVGAFDGDTIRSFIKHRSGVFGKIIAFEPDSASMWKLAEYLHTIGSFHNVSIFPCAVGNTEGMVHFEQDGSAASHVSSYGQSVLSTTLDRIMTDAPTYIKCDAEGSEIDVLDGARQRIAEYEPVLAWCLYHKQTDIWRIPALIREINPAYEIFIRCYSKPPFETVCYAVPKDRVEWDQVQV